MTHDQRVRDVAFAYDQPLTDVATWPVGVVLAFWRHAHHHGYLLPSAS